MVFHAAPRPLFATLPEYPTIGESIAFQINGLIVVFIALGTIWGLVELMGLFFRRHSQSAAKAPAPRPSSALPPVVIADGLTPEITAVVAAAVATVLRQPHRIQSITTEAPAPEWAHEGRREIFGSHRLR